MEHQKQSGEEFQELLKRRCIEISKKLAIAEEDIVLQYLEKFIRESHIFKGLVIKIPTLKQKNSELQDGNLTIEFEVDFENFRVFNFSHLLLDLIKKYRESVFDGNK